MNLFEGVHFNQMQIIGPIIVLIITMVLIALIYKTLFQRILPNRIFNFLFGPVCLIGFYVWAIPMQLGFHELFK